MTDYHASTYVAQLEMQYDRLLNRRISLQGPLSEDALLRLDASLKSLEHRIRVLTARAA